MDKEFTLEEIYALYMQDLYRYIYSLCKDSSLAEDIVQETFYRAYFYVETFQQEKIKPWLFKVAYHTFIDYKRKEKRMSYTDDLVTMPAVPSHISAEDEYMIKNSISSWWNLLESLAPEKRNIVILRDYYSFTYQEIADMCDLSLSQVKIVLYRARKEIQREMNKELD
ncbi:RNA polymerase sigma factor [Alkalihalophilus pseudofirmus]|uniref:RNA polymerase sigma factor n=1 Tax=Alkalihalophilus pseudofirmus TaxID=79885 RepID=A0AAJ2KSF9_ALKPS|nr:RNA polymerase sigma factor [Alkalihalophilus pseudofirmus]MDV2883637.1 RNA polymerase sigma factor [Alkalihalophilus pseudofirmus]